LKSPLATTFGTCGRKLLTFWLHLSNEPPTKAFDPQQIQTSVYRLPYQTIALFHALQTRASLQIKVYCHVKGTICMSARAHKMWVNFRVLKHNNQQLSYNILLQLCWRTVDESRTIGGDLIRQKLNEFIHFAWRESHWHQICWMVCGKRCILLKTRDILFRLNYSKWVLSWLFINVDYYNIDFRCNGCKLVDTSSLIHSNDENLAMRGAQKVTFGGATITGIFTLQYQRGTCSFCLYPSTIPLLTTVSVLASWFCSRSTYFKEKVGRPNVPAGTGTSVPYQVQWKVRYQVLTSILGYSSLVPGTWGGGGGWEKLVKWGLT
jgi:hypothetical protein